MFDFLMVVKALADENRIRALLALRDGELCVCDIIELLDLAPSTVSKHLSILRQARFIDGRKDGRWMYYRLAGKSAPPYVQDAIEWVCGSLSKDAVAKKDARKIKQIVKNHAKKSCQT
ncbi:Arsenical resistance operon repressor [hydrothermal vent metagenome]|uniref:Arsenical resistance operon repressor n=1 Tax=hydrothermal vent metagenome TaxID=652676 RepID=A0A3B1BRZ8_9ZZZZ